MQRRRVHVLFGRALECLRRVLFVRVPDRDLPRTRIHGDGDDSVEPDRHRQHGVPLVIDVFAD